MEPLITKPFNWIGLGGTFDHLHQGHKRLLRMAYALSKNLAIGLTTENLLKHKQYSDKIQTYQERKRNLEKYLEEIHAFSEECIKILPLKDFSGPAIEQNTMEALICSQETYQNAERINKIRSKKGISPLVIIVVPLIRNSKGEKVSSTNIRKNLNYSGGNFDKDQKN